MKALLVYESMVGNTEKIARAIAGGLAEQLDVTLADISTMPRDTSPLLPGMPAAAFDTRIHKAFLTGSAAHRIQRRLRRLGSAASGTVVCSCGATDPSAASGRAAEPNSKQRASSTAVTSPVPGGRIRRASPCRSAGATGRPRSSLNPSGTSRSMSPASTATAPSAWQETTHSGLSVLRSA
ncbi:hypothetical protein [Actinoplanes auranticolor]|uniref:Flavodoxin-like domain-containing protein n=1 Tax=Actinoplanes auranticolor TaxID=47988 RepID=A0A919SSJ9_9ACTN|nr:hypothetical protein [Actinoplanes auranticolor]GIM77701.1 hypothetical protein Aau02nite_77220 [Actinoplanes auranticolor]